jgi:hypothetical protein
MAEDDFCTCRFPRLSFVRDTIKKFDGGYLTAYFSLKYLFRENEVLCTFAEAGQLNPTLPCRAGPTACGHTDSQRWAGMYVSAEKVIIAGSKSVSCKACRPTNRKHRDIADLLLEEANDSPWVIFTPRSIETPDLCPCTHIPEGFCEDLARQITVAHLSQLQLRFRRRHTWVSVSSHMGFSRRRGVLKVTI